MARPIIAWSFSALNTFENCARKYWATKVRNLVSDINSDNLEGEADHKALQYHFAKGLPLPPKLAGLQPLSARIQSAPGETYVEYGMTLRQDFVPTKFNDWDNAWVRGAADLIKVNGTAAAYFDWKKGKYRESDDQIELTSLLIFAHFPQVEKVSGGLVFYNDGKVYPHIVHRADQSRLWNGFITRVKEMEQAKLEDSWPTNPNPLCGGCAYKDCPFNTVDERLAAEAKGLKWKWRPA